MKKFVVLICSALMLTAYVPAFAESTSTTASNQKDECLLTSKKCADQVDTIQQKIRKLNKEIAKGTKVYTPEELNRLKAKLDETNMMLDNLLQP